MVQARKARSRNVGGMGSARRVAVYVLFIVGAFLILRSGATVTGAVAGTGLASSLNVLVGFVMLVLALFLLKGRQNIEEEVELED